MTAYRDAIRRVELKSCGGTTVETGARSKRLEKQAAIDEFESAHGVAGRAAAADALRRRAPPGIYKWTDDQGVVHYSDQMPTDAVSKGATVLDKQGRAGQEDRPGTHRRTAQGQIEARRRRSASADRPRRRLSRCARIVALTHSLHQRGRDRRRAQPARSRRSRASIKPAEAYIADLTQSARQDVEKRKAALGTKPVPAALENELRGRRRTSSTRQNGFLATEKGRTRHRQLRNTTPTRNAGAKSPSSNEWRSRNAPRRRNRRRPAARVLAPPRRASGNSAAHICRRLPVLRGTQRCRHPLFRRRPRSGVRPHSVAAIRFQVSSGRSRAAYRRLVPRPIRFHLRQEIMAQYVYT